MTENLLRALPEVFVSTADITVMVSRYGIARLS
jgi:hypothetical protein